MILGLFMLAPSLKDFGPTPLETWEVRYTQPEPATEDCPTAAAALLRFLRNTPGCDFGARSCARRVHRTLETSLPYLASERRRRPCHSQDGSRCRQAGCQHTAMHTSKSHRRPACGLGSGFFNLRRLMPGARYPHRWLHGCFAGRSQLPRRRATGPESTKPLQMI